MPKRTIRVLNVEDSEPDVILLTRHLNRAGYEVISERVDTAPAMRDALASREWDIILCDYLMPSFDALGALKVLRKSKSDIPFIIISGTVGEEIAVKAMLTGADDYLPKDNLTRLVPAIERELKEAENRRRQRQTEDARRVSDERYRTLFEYAPDGIVIASRQSYYLDANASMCRMLGYSRDELIGKHASDIVANSEIEHIEDALRKIKASSDYRREWQFRRKDGSEFPGDVIVTTMPDGNLLAMIRDVTERNRAENKRKVISEIIQGVTSTRNLDEFLKIVHASISEIVYAENCFVMLHDSTADIVSFEFWVDVRDPRPEPKAHDKGFASYVLRKGVPLLLTTESQKELLEQGEAEQIGNSSASWLGVPLRTAESTIGVMVLQHHELENVFSERDVEFLSSVGDQIALAIERKRFEDVLRESESLLAASQRITHLGSWVIDLSESGKIKRINERWSDEHYRIFGFEPGQVEITDEIFYNSVHPDDREMLAKTLRRAIEKQQRFDIEYRIVLPGGSKRVVHAIAEVGLDSTGQPLKLVGSVQDITERKRAEEERRTISEIIQGVVTTPNLDQYLKLVHRLIGQIVSAENCIVMLHDPATDTFKYDFWADKSDPPSSPRPVGKGFSSYVLRTGEPLLLTKEIKKDLVARGKAVLSRRASQSWVGIPLRTSARTIGVLVLQNYERENAYSQHDLEFLTSVGDQVALAIDRKRAEDALSESEERYRSVVETAPDVIITIDESSTICFINPAAERVFGYAQAEMKGASLTMLMPEYLRHLHATGIERYQRTGEKHLLWDYVELTGLHKTGREIPITLSFSESIQDGRRYFTGIIRDISERKLVMEALRNSEERYRELVENAIDVIYSHDLDGNFTSVNQACERITGYRSDEALKINLARTVAPEYFERAKLMIAEKLAGRDITAYELEILAKDGHRVPVEVNTRLIYENGKAVGVQGIARDITERKKAEAALKLAEEKYRSIFENAVEGIFQSTVDGKFIAVNPALAVILGYDSPEQLIAERGDIGAQHYVDPNCRPELTRALEEYDVVVGYECEVYRRDGTKIWTAENIRCVRDEKGAIVNYEGSIADITERKLLEDQLRQSQKMEAVGVLAGGIAHDFNNLLTAINGYSDLTLRKMSLDDPLRRHIEEVKKAGDRATELTGQLLAFSRKQVLEPMVHNLNSVISNLEKMLRRIIKEDIELRTVLDTELGNIKADPGQIEQVIMNLAVNARDAMPDGGVLTIQTENVYLDDDYVSQHLTIAPGPFVKMTVTDTGSGIDAETKEHMFEPFFTTKDVGKGTGLGLSTVYGIVKQSGGDIMVYSEVGHGTTFKIYFPSVDDKVQRPKWKDIKAGYFGTETILLVEDEEIVRNLVREILTSGGYNVLEADSGKAAVAISKAYADPIHMLLTDVVMPGMSGTELKSRIVAMRPDIRSLFMSGYTDDSIIQTGVLGVDTAFIEKPFTPDALGRKVREILEYS